VIDIKPKVALVLSNKKLMITGQSEETADSSFGFKDLVLF
jgi:hypothetical protein